MALILTGVGIYYFVFEGIERVLDSQKITIKPIPLEEKRCGRAYRCATLDYGYAIITKDGRSLGTFSASLNFTTDKVFSVQNRINFTSTATVSEPNSVKNMYFILLTLHDNFTKILQSEGQVFVSQAKGRQSIIDMQKISDSSFEKSGWWEIPFETSVNIFGLVVTQENEYIAFPSTLPLFTVESHLTKLQADTNIAILDQIRKSETSNALIEGLTWIGVSVIPILLGGDILLRLFLDPYLSRK